MDRSLRMCGNRGGRREAHLYNTESNVVDIVVARDDSDVNSYSYLIQYQGILILKESIFVDLALIAINCKVYLNLFWVRCPSMSANIQLIMLQLQNEYCFLTVIGCPMPEPPEGATIEVSGDMVAIKCNNTQMTFHLVCTGTQWTGPWRNCTEGEP